MERVIDYPGMIGDELITRSTGADKDDVVSMYRRLREMAQVSGIRFITTGRVSSVPDDVPTISYQVLKVYIEGGQVRAKIRAIKPDERAVCKNPDLVDINPLDQGLLPQQQAAVMEECATNPAYFLNLLLSLPENKVDQMLFVEEMTSFSIRHTLANKSNFDELFEVPEMCCDDRFRSDHIADHGERTNKKLRVQPFYHRQSNGKPKKW